MVYLVWYSELVPIWCCCRALSALKGSRTHPAAPCEGLRVEEKVWGHGKSLTRFVGKRSQMGTPAQTWSVLKAMYRKPLVSGLKIQGGKHGSGHEERPSVDFF